MKKIVFFISLLYTTFLLAQVTNTGKPISWSKVNLQTIAPINMPAFDLKAIQEEDAINDQRKDIPYRFGYKFDTNYSIQNIGVWSNLEDGSRIWRGRFKSDGAQSLNFIFTDFYIPKGATIYLYNNEKTELLGAYTSVENNQAKTLGTWLVNGNDIWIEYYEPASEIGKGNFTISNITHGYRSKKYVAKILNQSGDCNIDVNCPIGTDLDPLKDESKKGTALLLSGGSSFCTGSLVNNTANDGTPYFLTANHCYSNPASWSFRFNWISVNTVCVGSTANVENSDTYTISGATLKARRYESDFCLVEINNPIPNAWDRVWAGWDRTTNNPASVYGTHHPRGDIMKTCRDSNPVSTDYSAGDRVWRINDWEMGVTEGGSSGSPLFNQDGRLIGQLWRGSAACSGITDNGGYDEYGRFNISWDAGSTIDTRLKEWLDPGNTGDTFIDNYPPSTVYAVDALGYVQVENSELCGESSVQPTITIKNRGTDVLTSATIEYSYDGGTINTVNWTGNLVQNAAEDITLPIQNFAIAGTHSVQINIANPNGGTDDYTANNQSSINFYIIEPINTTQIKLELLTDDYCEETSWEFVDENGTVLYSGGPYTQNVQDNTVFNETFTVTTGNCYEFIIYDDAEDGICCNYGTGYYILRDADDNIIATGGEFTVEESTKINVNEPLNVEDIEADKDVFIISPNPSKGIYTVQFKESDKVAYSVYNTTGKLIQQGTLTQTNNTLDITSYPNGVYILQVKNSKEAYKLIKK